MWAKLLNQIADLVNVKSIVTFCLIGCLCYLAVKQETQVSPELLATVVGSIITFFFTKKSKQGGNDE